MAGFDPFSFNSIVSTQRRARSRSPLDDFLSGSTGLSLGNSKIDRLLADMARQQDTARLNQQYAQEQAADQAAQAREANGDPRHEESFFDYILNSISKPLEAVKNFGQGVGQLATGEFAEAGKSALRTVGSLTPFSESALGILGLEDDVGALLDDGTGFSTGESGNQAFGSDLRARDVASGIGELLGEEATNTDAQGSLFSEFGESGIQDALTVLLTGAEIVGDPANFLFGAGAANKAIKAGKTVEGALDGLATVKALRSTGLASIADEAGIALSRAPEALIGAKGGDEALKLFRDAKKAALDDLARTDNLTGQFFAHADDLGGVENPLFDALNIATKQFGSKASDLLPGTTFAEQYGKGQRQLINGPYAALDQFLPDKLKEKTFDLLTGANKVFGGGSAIFSDSNIASRLGRLGKLRDEELDEIAKATFADGNTSASGFKQTLIAARDAIRSGVIQDSQSAAVAEALTNAPRLRRDVGLASELVFDEHVKLIEDALKALPEDQAGAIHARIIKQVEEGGTAGLLDEGFGEYDGLVMGLASSVKEAEGMLVSFQRGNGVWIKELEGQLDYFSRSAWSDEFLQWLQRNPAVADSLKDARATAARTAREATFEEAEAALRRKVNEIVPDALPDSLPLFEGDIVRNLRKQVDDAGDRIFRARIQDELIRTNRLGFDPDAAKKLASGLRQSLEGTVSDALLTLDEIDHAKVGELTMNRNASRTQVDELKAQIAELQTPSKQPTFGFGDELEKANTGDALAQLQQDLKFEELRLSKLEDKLKGVKPEAKGSGAAVGEVDPRVAEIEEMVDEVNRARELIEKTTKPAKEATEGAKGAGKTAKDAEKQLAAAESRMVKAVELHIRNAGMENFDEAFKSIPADAKALWVRQQLRKAGHEADLTSKSGLDIFLEDGGLRSALPRDLDSLVNLGMSNVPKSITKEYKRVLNLGDNASAVTKGIDKVNGFFRSFLLSAPQSVATDVIGNAMTAVTLGGLDHKHIARGMGAYARNAKEESLLVKGAQALAKGEGKPVKTIFGTMDEAEIYNELQKRGLFNQINAATQREQKVGTALDEFLQAGKPASKTRDIATTAAKPFQKVADEAFTIREFQDNGFRMSKAVEVLENGGTFDDAVAKAREIFFDYGDATNFEKSTLRRVFMFYAFTKKAMGLLGRSAFEKPIGNKLLRLMAGAGVNQGDEDFPNWAKKTLGLHVGTDEAGNPIMVGVNGNIVNTAADKLEGNAVHNFLMSLSPVAKILLEVGTDRDLFTGKPIGFDPDNASKRIRNGAADRAPAWMRYLPDFAKAALDFREVVDEEGKTRNYEMDSRLRWAFEGLAPFGQWSRVVEKASFADERKNIGQDLGGLLGVNTRSIAGGSKEEADLRHVRKAKLGLEAKLNTLAGRPLAITRSGALEFNEETAAGKRMADAIAPVLDAAEQELLQSGAPQREVDEMLYQIELREITRRFPQMSAVRETYEALSDAENYLEDPEGQEQRQEDKLLRMKERLQKRRQRDLLSFLPR